jgi:cell division protein FtsB
MQGELEAAEASIKNFEARCMAIEEALATLDRNKTAVEERCQQVLTLLMHAPLSLRYCCMRP